MSTSAPPSTGRATPVMKFASSDARNKAAFATSQGLPILWRSGTRASRAAAISARLLPATRARIDRHWGIYQSGQDDIGAHAKLGVLDGNLLSEGDHPGFSRFVGYVRVPLPSGD